jgi:hypothetical protein
VREWGENDYQGVEKVYNEGTVYNQAEDAAEDPVADTS